MASAGQPSGRTGPPARHGSRPCRVPRQLPASPWDSCPWWRMPSCSALDRDPSLMRTDPGPARQTHGRERAQQAPAPVAAVAVVVVAVG
ncbi:unnamed protein product, partial [Discosporangium mesarthrocarpum]